MEFRRLSDVSLIEEASDIANVLIEENGEIKRVPKTQVGGTGFPTAIIKDSHYDHLLEGTFSDGDPIYECLNMTFEDAYEIMLQGEVLEVIGMLSMSNPSIACGIPMFLFNASIPCIMLLFAIFGLELYWTEDGISTTPPQQEK